MIFFSWTCPDFKPIINLFFNLLQIDDKSIGSFLKVVSN